MVWEYLFLLCGPKVRSKLPALAAELRAFSSLLSLPSQAQSVIKAFLRQGIGVADVINTARFFLSRLESFFASQKVFQIFRGRAEASLCDLFRSASAALHKSHRLAKARIKVVATVFLSVGLCQSRKDPYLPLEPLSVRLLPRPTGLPPMAFAVSFRIRFADAKTAVKHHRPKRADGRFRLGDELTVVPRPEGVLVDICMWMRNCLARILSCPSELPLSLRLIIYIDTLYSYSCG